MSKAQAEICCGSLHDCINAQKGGADRIELNAAMELGGLTCSPVLLKQVKEEVNLPVYCMVRSKSGGFFYQPDELDLMYAEAVYLLERKADGIVFGFLNADKTINEEATASMVDLIHSYGKKAVFHRALEQVPDIYAAVETLIDLGVDRVLTTGGPSTAMEGIETLADLQKKYGDKIEILPCGSITAENVAEILEKTGCHQAHSSCKTFIYDYPDDFEPARQIVDLQNVRDFSQVIHDHQ